MAKYYDPAIERQLVSSERIADSIEVLAYVALQFLDWERDRRATSFTRPAPDVVRELYPKVG